MSSLPRSIATLLEVPRPRARRPRRVLRAAVLLIAFVGALLTSPPSASAQTLELVADGLQNIVAFTFAPDGRIFFTEKNSGQVRIIENGVLNPIPATSLFVMGAAESGLNGLALDPDFENNGFFYVHFSEGVAGGGCQETRNTVLRFTEVDGVGQDPVEIFSSPLFGDCRHTVGNIHFGPDGKLYISLGDDDNSSNGQDLTTYPGKIHRINSDGTIPEDNPFFGEPGVLQSIYAYGLRNSFDFDWDPISNTLFATENGPFCDDEVNRVMSGYSYGWRFTPVQLCDDENEAFNDIPPLLVWEDTVGPTGIHFYRGNLFSEIDNALLVCNVNFGEMKVLDLDPFRARILGERTLPIPNGVRCDLGIATGPDGGLYFVEGGGFAVGSIWKVLPPTE